MSYLASNPTYRLRVGGLECDLNGVRLAGRGLLVRAESPHVGWAPAPTAEVERALFNAYGEEVDASGKIAGLVVISAALNNGDMAKAQIAALLLKFPDPFDLPNANGDRAAVLKAAGWASKEWDPDKHPRAGTAPNSGWFAPKDGADFEFANSEESEDPGNETAAAPASPRTTEIQLGLSGDRDDCFRICSELALPTGDFGIRFQRCVLACTSGGNSGFKEWDAKFKQR